MAKERRQHTRVSFPQIRVKVPTGRKFRDEFLRDLSAGGLFVSTNKTLELGSEVQIQILRSHETDEPLALNGKVVRVEEGGKGEMGGMAVEFAELTDEISQQIRELVEEFIDDDVAGPGGSTVGLEELENEIKGLKKELEEERKSTEEREKDVKKADKQIQALRDRLEKIEIERDELLTAKVALETELESAQSSKKDNAELEAAQRESQKLRERLKEVEGSLEQLQAELSQHHADEEVTRNLAERLANEKLSAEKKLEEEQQSSGEQIQALRQELEATQKLSREEIATLKERLERAEEELEDLRQAKEQLDVEVEDERKSRVEAEARLEVATNNLKVAKEQAERVEELETQLRKQSATVEEAQERAQWSEERALKALEQLDGARAKERDLRRLLAAVSPDAASRGGEDKEPPPEPFARSREGAAHAEVIEVVAETADDETGDVGDDEQRAASGEEEFELVPEEALEEDPASVASAQAMTEIGSDEVVLEPAEQSEGVGEEEEAEIAAGAAADAPAEPPAEDQEEAPAGLGPGALPTESDFRRCLEDGASIELTERFSRLEPVSRNDIQVSDWLKEARTLAELKEAASRGKMTETDLLETLYLFFQRSLILLHPA